MGGKKKKGLLFCLDGVGRSHVIAGDVTALSGGQGARQPPVPFSAQMKRKPGLIAHPDHKLNTVSLTSRAGVHQVSQSLNNLMLIPLYFFFGSAPISFFSSHPSN